MLYGRMCAQWVYELEYTSFPHTHGMSLVRPLSVHTSLQHTHGVSPVRPPSAHTSLSHTHGLSPVRSLLAQTSLPHTHRCHLYDLFKHTRATRILTGVTYTTSLSTHEPLAYSPVSLIRPL